MVDRGSDGALGHRLLSDASQQQRAHDDSSNGRPADAKTGSQERSAAGDRLEGGSHYGRDGVEGAVERLEGGSGGHSAEADHNAQINSAALLLIQPLLGWIMPRMSLASCYVASLGALLVAAILVPLFGYLFQTTLFGFAACLSALFILAASGAFVQATAFVLAASAADERYLFRFFVGQAAAGVLAALCGFTPYLIRQVLRHRETRFMASAFPHLADLSPLSHSSVAHIDSELPHAADNLTGVPLLLRRDVVTAAPVANDDETTWSLYSSVFVFTVCTFLTLVCLISYRALTKSRTFSKLLALPASPESSERDAGREETVPLAADASPHARREPTAVATWAARLQGAETQETNEHAGDGGSRTRGGRGGVAGSGATAGASKESWADKRVKAEQRNLFLTLFVTGLVFPACTAEWRPESSAAMAVGSKAAAATSTVWALMMSGFTAQQLQLVLATSFQVGDLVSRLCCRWFKFLMLLRETAAADMLRAGAEEAASGAAGPLPLPSWAARESQESGDAEGEDRGNRQEEARRGKRHAERASSPLTVPVALRFLFVPFFLVSQLASLPSASPAAAPVFLKADGGLSASAVSGVWDFLQRLLAHDFSRLFLVLLLALSNGLYATIAVLNASAAAADSVSDAADNSGDARSENSDKHANAGRAGDENGTEARRRGPARPSEEAPGDADHAQVSFIGAVVRGNKRASSASSSAFSFALSPRDRERGQPDEGEADTPLLRRRTSVIERESQTKRQEVAFGLNMVIVAAACAGSWTGFAIQYFMPSSR
ncbi:hypothetical protein BESB_043500 [Besnoitia besnoiti]|uniref:Transmembrane protein n=1 Tax=Besnoitia besnoiti TaxID=94643 RepID=A0A2A9MCE3_BESBE|nr:hypothetical protein BESB_043500 [Besnoitia besnoiti]PFH36158.1 hypothetical protein BESB_043500 [Besnoitia besnoiti]